MKTSKIFLGLVAVLFAAGSAFASSKSVRLVPVFYFSTPSTCTQVFVEETCPGTLNPCEKDLFLEDGTPLGINDQIYRTQLDPATCANPYREL